VILWNAGPQPFAIERGDRIAQLVIAPVVRVELEEGDLDDTTRGAGGFGSTGAA
jgi:dUTP pyrophosphatase